MGAAPRFFTQQSASFFAALYSRASFLPMTSTPPRLSGFHEPLDPIIQKMLAKNPADRYPSLEAMMRDIANLRAPEPVEHVARHQRHMTMALGIGIAGAVAVMLWLSFHNR